MNVNKRKKLYSISLAKNKETVIESVVPVIKQTVTVPVKLEEIAVSVDVKVEEKSAELPIALKEISEDSVEKVQNDKKKNKFKKPVEEETPSDV